MASSGMIGPAAADSGDAGLEAGLPRYGLFLFR